MLGTSPEAGAEELRRAFVRLARRFHPDRHVGADPATRREAERRMREITEAWAVLGDPERRRRYDLGMGDRARSGSAGSPGRSGPGATGGGAGAGSAGSGASAGTGATAGPGASAGGRSGTGSRATGGARTTGAAGIGSEGRHWRAYAPSAGASSQRSAGQQLVMLSPLFCVATAGGFGVLGALIGWPPFFAMALVCLIVAAAAFFMLPIWAMTRGSSRRGRARGPKRTY